MGGTPKSTGTARYFWCRLGPIPLCWTCGNVYYNDHDCLCGQMPEICKHHVIQYDPFPVPEYRQPWEKCQTGHGSSGGGLINGQSDDLLLLDSQEQFEGYKKCYTHNGTWSASGRSIDTSSFPAVNGAIFDVGRFDNADFLGLVASSQGFSTNLTRRFTLGESGPSTSMSVVYSLTIAGFLVTFVWLIQRTFLCRSRSRRILRALPLTIWHNLNKKGKVVVSIGIEGVD
ncbi:hypothetical protein N0V87_008720 [Didymella glomerata]|uniref:Uncharacterized protein n=1 Tax=Didymella glomerata TaxID=749621 RepID=A0A9W8WSH1_9PLEO|nr:hypothetical protein N0V87_008720 [Didymella glomerata]